jgi:hypothetical protein
MDYSDHMGYYGGMDSKTQYLNYELKINHKYYSGLLYFISMEIIYFFIMFLLHEYPF